MIILQITKEIEAHAAKKVEIRHAHPNLLPDGFQLSLQRPSPPCPAPLTLGNSCSCLGHFSNVGGSGYGQTGGQDVSLIMTQSDLLPAPDSLPPAPDTSSMDVGLEGMEGPEGWNVWTETHRQQLQQGDVSDSPVARHDGMVHKLAHPASACSRLFASLFFRSVPHFCPSCLAESQLLPATVCAFAFGGVCVCVCVLEWWCSRHSCSLCSEVPRLTLFNEATSALVNI